VIRSVMRFPNKYCIPLPFQQERSRDFFQVFTHPGDVELKNPIRIQLVTCFNRTWLEILVDFQFIHEA